MRVWLNPDKLTDYQMTVDDVATALQAYNVEVSAGQFGGAPAVPGQRLNASIIVQNLLKTPEEFGAIPIRTNPDGSIVRVRDVGADGTGNRAIRRRMPITTASPRPAMAIRQVAGANALDTANAIRAKMEEMSRYFPHGMKVVYPYDTTPFIKVAIEEVVKTLFEAILLVFLVMWLFMGNIRATLIPTIAVPVVLLGTFARAGAVRILHQHADDVRHGAGHRPAGGRRHRGGGKRGTDHERGRASAKRSHGRKSMEQITSALIGIGAGAFGGVRPHGVLCRFDRRHLPPVFRDHHRLHAVVGGGGVDPDAGACARRFSSRWRRGTRRPKARSSFCVRSCWRSTAPFAWVRDRYLRVVGHSISKKVRYVFVYILLVAAVGFLFLRLPTGFLPEEDQGIVLAQILMPTGATMEQTDAMAQQVQRYFRDQRERGGGILHDRLWASAIPDRRRTTAWCSCG